MKILLIFSNASKNFSDNQSIVLTKVLTDDENLLERLELMFCEEVERSVEDTSKMEYIYNQATTFDHLDDVFNNNEMTLWCDLESYPSNKIVSIMSAVDKEPVDEDDEECINNNVFIGYVLEV